MKTIKAWAFLADGENGKYFITNGHLTEIYLAKPKPRANPFDYSLKRKPTWKPTEIKIIIP